MEQFFAQLEGTILLWIQEYIRNDLLTPVVTFITHLGDAGVLWIVLTVLFLCIPKLRRTGFLMMCSLLLNTLLNNLILKNLVARTRPYEIVEGLVSIVGKQSDFSFPSGHTGSSFAAAVVIFLMCPRKVGVPVLILAVLISLSRLYVGVHFPTDVLAGAIIGTLSAVLVCHVYRKKNPELSMLAS